MAIIIGLLKALAGIPVAAVYLVYPFGRHTPHRSNCSSTGSEPMADDRFELHHLFNDHGHVLVVTGTAVEADGTSTNFTNGFTL